MPYTVEPPAYPHPSLSDGPVLRAVIGTALFLAVLAVLSLGIGMVMRRSARAVTFVALAVDPRRSVVLAAKAAVVTAAVLGAGLLSVVGSLAVGWWVPMHGYPPAVTFKARDA